MFMKVDLQPNIEGHNCFNTFLNALRVYSDKFVMYKATTNEFFFKEDTTDEELTEIGHWVDAFTCKEAEANVYEASPNTEMNTVIKLRNPTISENYERIGTLWLNKNTGELFINTENTPDANVWVGVKTGQVIKPLPDIKKFDFFDDGSAILYYPFENNVNDLGGLYNATENGKIKYIDTTLGNGIYFSNNAYLTLPTDIPYGDNLSVSVCFKAKRPSRYNCLVHFSKNGNNYLSLWIYKDFLKVILNDRTVSVRKMARADWDNVFHVVLQSNGDIYINGELAVSTGISIDPKNINMNPLIGADRDGVAINDFYKGFVFEYRLFNKLLTLEEINDLYQVESEIYNKDVV